MRILALIDGEHYLPVTRAALKELAACKKGTIVGLVFLGGTEKLKTIGSIRELELPYIMEKDRFAALEKGIDQFLPDLVFDLSDEPVVTYEDRFHFANLILSHNIPYAGPDFRFEPPEFADIMNKPSLTIAGTGKRVGKTAIGGYVGRVLSGQEGSILSPFRPCIVTMGRGGPPQPEIIPGSEISITPDYLLNEFKQGKHAASDHYEDALSARLTTIGCRRCGGGMTGKVFSSVVVEGAKIANSLSDDFVIFEGSGASLPPVKTDAWIMVVGAQQKYSQIENFMGPFRLHKADLILIAQCDEPLVANTVSLQMEQIIKKINPSVSIIRTRFRPKPLKSISGKKIVWINTAPKKMGPKLKLFIEETYNCQIKKISHFLSNRVELVKELRQVEGSVDTVLVELKAAAVDVVTQWGLGQGLEVVYQDNIPLVVDDSFDLKEEIIYCANLAKERFKKKSLSL